MSGAVSARPWTAATCVVAILGAACTPSSTPLERDLTAIRRESTHQELVARADAAAMTGDTTRAEQYYVAALRGGGEPARIVRRVVAACVADGRYPAALEHADRYLEAYPDDVDVLFAAATLHAALGSPEQATQQLRAILVHDAKFAEAYFALAAIHRNAGEAAAEREALLAYLKLVPAGRHAGVARSHLAGAVTAADLPLAPRAAVP